MSDKELKFASTYDLSKKEVSCLKSLVGQMPANWLLIPTTLQALGELRDTEICWLAQEFAEDIIEPIGVSNKRLNCIILKDASNYPGMVLFGISSEEDAFQILAATPSKKFLFLHSSEITAIFI